MVPVCTECNSLQDRVNNLEELFTDFLKETTRAKSVASVSIAAGVTLNELQGNPEDQFEHVA